MSQNGPGTARMIGAMNEDDRKSSRWSAYIALAIAAVCAWPGAAQAPSGALAGIQTGLWQLRPVSGGQGQARTVCVGNPLQFIQLRHAGQSCTQRILSDDGRRANVRYQCQGGGWGQTDLRVETPRLVSIDTQGIADGGPFHNNYEARRTGDCG